jgi:hypothetical protein
VNSGQDFRMKKSALLFVGFSAAAVFSHAAPLDDEPLAELRLGSGKVLKLAQVRSCSSTAALVKHADGAASVKYTDFPAEYQEFLSAKRLSLEEKTNTAQGAAEKVTDAPELTKVSYDFSSPPALDSSALGSVETTLSGEVFVETQDMGNVKLGGVKVSVYSKADYRKQVDWYFANPWEASRAHSRNAELLMKSGDMTTAMKQFASAMEAAAIGWQLVASAQFSTTTDADGRFTLKHRVSPPYFVVAHASRLVDGETENYRWAVISDLIDDTTRLLLFNDNME